MQSCQLNSLDLDRLDTELRLTPEPAPELFRKIAANVGSRDNVETDSRLESLLVAEAWTDAALLVVEVFLVGWGVRYLRYDGGEWSCLLSPRTGDFSFDDPAESAHRFLSVAILRAVLAALCLNDRPPRALASVPSAADLAIQYVCCDNFA